MIRRIKRIVYAFGNIVFACAGICTFYLLLAFVFGLFNVNQDYDPSRGDIEVFLVSNGVHSTLLLPAKNDQKDWYPVFSAPELKQAQADPTLNYIQIGWGSRTFYTAVPKWKNLRANTAFQSLLYDRGAFNVEYVSPPQEGGLAKSIMLTPAQYNKLVRSIEKNIVYSDGMHAKLIADIRPDNKNQAYFEANNSYTPWRTCNQWTRNQLSFAGVSMPAWAPFASSLFWHLN